MSDYHALVLGASGLLGWAVVNELLSPRSTSSPRFAKVTALVNRPLQLEDAFWPEPAASRPELALRSGVNLSASDEQVRRALRENVPDISTVTHLYYFVFKQNADMEEEVATNVGMMKRCVNFINEFAPNFQFFVFPGGTRGYAIYLPGGHFRAPLTESMANDIPADYAKTVCYPHFRALLADESAGRSWTWCELCPDTVVGFAPNGTGWSLAAHWAIYLFLWKQVYGAGAEIPFPGTTKGYDARSTETSASMLAEAAIWASSNPEVTGGELFNVADCETPGSMRERWPAIAGWFGLKGVEPHDDSETNKIEKAVNLAAKASSDNSQGIEMPGDFIQRHKALLLEAGVNGVEIWHAHQLDNYGYHLDFDRHLSLQKLRAAGFKPERKPEEGWFFVFEMMKKAKMIG